MELHNVTSMKKVPSFLHTEFFLNLFEILLCCTKRVKKAATLRLNIRKYYNTTANIIMISSQIYEMRPEDWKTTSGRPDTAGQHINSTVLYVERAALTSLDD